MVVLKELLRLVALLVLIFITGGTLNMGIFLLVQMEEHLLPWADRVSL
jgi:hypothetical protein